MVNLQRITKEAYYKESKLQTPFMLENIRKSQFQKEFRDYLANYRGMDKSILEEMGMFYLLDGYGELDEITEDDHIRYILGLKLGDFVKQRERFIFPILDQDGVILGFEGYDYEEDGYKYLMSLSLFAERQKIFFNMQNLAQAYTEGVCILVEGLMDSVSLNALGYKNNLALLGRRLTPHHVRILNRFDLVIIIPDKDNEGQKALEIWENQLSTKTVTIDLKPRMIDRTRVFQNEHDELEKQTITKELKDIDDFIWGVEASKEKLAEVYHQILTDKDNPFLARGKYKL